MYVTVYPNPATDLVAIQLNHITNENYFLELYNVNGKLLNKTIIYQGSTIAYFDTRTLYSGEYQILITNGLTTINKKIIVSN